MNSTENPQAMKKIADMCRWIAFVILGVHYYHLGYVWFVDLGLNWKLTDRILSSISGTGLLDSFNTSKYFCLLFLLFSLMGTRGRKGRKFNLGTAFLWLLWGHGVYFLSGLLLYFFQRSPWSLIGYYALCSMGLLMVIKGMTTIARIIWTRIDQQDIFNLQNQTFPQQQGLLENEFSVNLPYRFRLKNRSLKGWINVINPFRALLVLGNPGSGKSYYIIRHVISQHIKKGFSMLVYDFKYDDLSKIAYHHWILGGRKMEFFRIDFDDLARSHRCNPLEPSAMNDITDAAESARTILLGLNREWIKRQGDFFVESAINLLTAVIWYLRRYQDGEYCTLPHVIELMQQDYDRLFSLLRSQEEIQVLINPFVNAYLNNAMEQLEGQVASAKVALARLSSPQLYYVLSGNDFTLDINNPESPKIVCMGNNPQKVQIYGAVLSLFVNRLIKQVNRKGMQKCSLIFDEFPTIYLNNIDSLIATARSNRVATCLCVQDISQLRKDYGRDQADVILNIVGNVISGQVSGETAKQLSERFGKIMQERQSLSLGSSDTSIGLSSQLELAIPPSTISSLSSGEFVGMVADDPQVPVSLKAFHGKVINHHRKLASEESSFREPEVIRKLDEKSVQQIYLMIKREVQEITYSEMDRLLSDPASRHLVVPKK
ncbi:conjugal transfer protein MobC [Sphingobacterium endophyticum]|uniref:conjugal transfer protein MobC n=1 Tax=Sphingobacterium endophyticum TaxID=2546448 RepID=UPI0012E29EC8|nr:conjugal transfer protein MobC [Sphingobacterium endophyticum]